MLHEDEQIFFISSKKEKGNESYPGETVSAVVENTINVGKLGNYAVKLKLKMMDNYVALIVFERADK